MNFGLAPMKREGDIVDPDTLDWECDINTCEACLERYQQWKAAFKVQEERRET